MCLRQQGGGKKFLLKIEKKIQELQGDLSLSLSLTTLNGEKQNFS